MAHFLFCPYPSSGTIRNLAELLMRTNCGPLWLMVQLFSRQRRLVFGTASVPIISMASIYVIEAQKHTKTPNIFTGQCYCFVKVLICT